jgi:ComF family protein
MHHFKQNQRGFNQTVLIAQWIEKKFAIRYQSLLLKTQKTHAQMHLNRYDRLFNQSNVFAKKANLDIQGKNILLIDDVITTGTTIEEAAKVLKTNGAHKIIALALAGG